MEVNRLNLKNSINKAYLKVKPNRTRIEAFKKNITALFDQIKESESEEFHKNIISEFLKNTYYSPDHYINTKGRADLVIHTGKDTNTPVGVIFETKKPGNKQDMPTTDNLNSRAFHELILYFMRERVKGNNLEVKHLIITNVFEWFIFNANDFEKLFASDKTLIKQFTDFEDERLSGKNTDFFYNMIAAPFIENSDSQISVTCFDIRDFETIIKNSDRQDDNKLIALYKILSPEHLLKLPFANDSNNLDKTFYNELLHIIGLEETKEGSKKIIGRKKTEKRNQGSLIENAITIIKSEDCLSQLTRRSDFGKDSEEQLFNVALELVITWINRILFLKLLEGQLVRYNSGDRAFRFLSTERVHDYDELNKLFFQVLAVKEGDRNEKINEKFGNIPYLNSSLFEPNDLEHKTIRISNLDDHFKLPVLNSTVLKDKTGKKLTGEIDLLHYLFEFLDSYDFSSEGSEDIQEENKTLINASVLGLIFEKINGYKDGSFFTPGFITMYMCHETIRRAVVQKFNEAKGWKCETVSDVYNKIEDIKEADTIINSLRICDPAVGSGHFLVSALNEIIAIKSELRILTDKKGERLKEYTVEVINDELIITDEQSNLFEYNPRNKESQRVQEALFQEKQKIIESCLFGVDINPNSVKICRLRLWIELLKNAYYKPEEAGYRLQATGVRLRELETLPNIDINIKCGNSLISRYPLDADIKTALKSSRWNVDNYREAVMNYRNAQSKDEKRTMEQLISKIKNDFETEVSKSDKRFLKLNKLNGELLSLTNQSTLFELSKTKKEEWNKKVKKLTEEIKKYETELQEIKSNKIYENAFEWRFEFPEVLNNEGDFIGFDVVIGNPPYGVIISRNEISIIQNNYYEFNGLLNQDSYVSFIALGKALCTNCGLLAYIVPNTWRLIISLKYFRDTLISKFGLYLIDSYKGYIFEDAVVDCDIIFLNGETQKIKINWNEKQIRLRCQSINSQTLLRHHAINTQIGEKEYIILEKIFLGKKKLIDVFEIKNGVKPYEVGKGIPPQTKEVVKEKPFTSNEKRNESFIPLIGGSDFEKYHIRWNNDNWISYGKWLAAPREESIFNSQEKIIVRQTSDKIIATIIEKGFVMRNNTHIILNKAEASPISLRILLGLLNSKLFDFLYWCINPEKGEVLAEVKAFHLYGFPLPENHYNLSKIENFVNQILTSKKSDPAADTSALEAKIDRLVYELYGLTEEEIRIVEGEV